MSLQKLLEQSSGSIFHKEELTDKRISDQLNNLRQYFSYFREYPDMMLDWFAKISGDKCKFKGLFFYQRVFLRVCIRYKYVYATFPRAFSKSFLAVLILIMRCILYPNADLFVTTGGKEQATSITKQKVEEWFDLVPALRNEVDWRPGKGTKPTGKDDICYKFKNGAKLSIVGASQKSRGGRKTGGLVEEVITVDQTILNEVIIPMMNVDRRLGDGTRRPEESVNKSQIYVTSAGYKNSYAYEKLLAFLVNMIIKKNEHHTFVMGGSLEIPLMEGLLEESFVNDLKDDPTFTEESFDREYKSLWSGASEGSLFSSDLVERSQVVRYPERKPKQTNLEHYYIFGIDFGRYDCTTEICVFKVYPPKNGGLSTTTLVNIFSIKAENSLFQAVDIHKIYEIYKPEAIVYDYNGPGIGLLDILTIPFTDPRTDKKYEAWGVINDDKNDYKQSMEQFNSKKLIYKMKADEKINNDAYENVISRFKLGKIRLLTSEKDASETLSLTKAGDRMTLADKKRYLNPYRLTDILKDEMLNLRDDNYDKPLNQKVKPVQINKSTPKDKWSAFQYGLYYINKRDKEYENGGSDFSDYFYVF